MVTRLHINVSARPLKRSRSRQIAAAFIQSYRHHHPSDAMVHLDLYREPVPHLDDAGASVYPKSGKVESALGRESAKTVTCMAVGRFSRGAELRGRIADGGASPRRCQGLLRPASLDPWYRL